MPAGEGREAPRHAADVVAACNAAKHAQNRIAAAHLQVLPAAQLAAAGAQAVVGDGEQVLHRESEIIGGIGQ